MNTKVLILGGTPEALYAFEGAKLAGFQYEEIKILATGLEIPSNLLWLHDLPDGRSDGEGKTSIRLELEGTPQGFMRNKWKYPYEAAGQLPGGLAVANRTVDGFDPWFWLPMAWKAANVEILEQPIQYGQIRQWASCHDYIIQTFPSHASQIQQLEANRFPVFFGRYDQAGSFSVMNGGDRHIWIRYTEIFGKLIIEYKKEANVPRTQDRIDHLCAQYGMHTGARVTYEAEIHPVAKPLSLRERIQGVKKNIFLVGRKATLSRVGTLASTRNETFFWLRDQESLKIPEDQTIGQEEQKEQSAIKA